MPSKDVLISSLSKSFRDATVGIPIETLIIDDIRCNPRTVTRYIGLAM